MRTFRTAVIVCLMLTLLPNRETYAWSSPCDEFAFDVASRYETSSAIFSGEIVSIRPLGKERTIWVGKEGDLEVIFKPLKIWKGESTKTITVRAPVLSDCTSVPFERGKAYLVFADLGAEKLADGTLGNELMTRRALGSKLLSEAQDDVAYLNRR